MKKSALISVLILFSSTVTFAGLTGLTMHSRGNCINNESITWDMTQEWGMHTESIHSKSRLVPFHTMEDGEIKYVKIDGYNHKIFPLKNRSFAGCYGEGGMPGLDPVDKWSVTGKHYYQNPRSAKNPYAINYFDTIARDCNLIEGWD